MLTISSLKVQGFRGYTNYQELVFDNDAVFLLGDNHKGKSSTLNAIEWCLFGDESVGGTTGLRERIGWEVPNRNMDPSKETFVELTLKDEQGSEYKVLRKYITAKKDALTVTFPDNKSYTDAKATSELSSLIKLSYRDFVTTVYQRQEAIRSFLVQEPKDRNDAIDRLMGLSDYKNIFDNLDYNNIPKKEKQISDVFIEVEKSLEDTLRLKKNDLDTQKMNAKSLEIDEDQFNLKGLKSKAETEIFKPLTDFTQSVNLTLGEIPVLETEDDFVKFKDSVKREITRLRSELPDLQTQIELNKIQIDLSNLKNSFTELKQKVDENQKSLNIFIEQNGDDKAIQEKINELDKLIKDKEEEIKREDSKIASIKYAISYLKMEKVNKNICPVCGKETEDLLTHLETEMKEQYDQAIEKLTQELESMKADFRKQNSLLNEYSSLIKVLNESKEKLSEFYKTLSEALKREITEKDDVVVILNIQIEEIAKKLQSIKERIDSKQQNLSRIESELEPMEIITEILKLTKEINDITNFEEDPTFQELKAKRNEAMKALNNIQRIGLAISEASKREAKDKVERTSKIIEDYFCKITDNPAIKKIKFEINEESSRIGSNDYKFKDVSREEKGKDEKGKDLIPILSQGDMNALALAIYLGMALEGAEDMPFDFIIMDDPSQSMGSHHKRNLVDILNEVLKRKKVIVSTMDAELQDLLSKKITKMKTCHNFEDWTDTTGPIINKEEL